MKPALGKGTSILAQKLEDVRSTSELGVPSTRPPILPSSLSLSFSPGSSWMAQVQPGSGL